MTTITITISIDSEGQVQVGPTAVTNGHNAVPEAQAVFADELVPLPPEPQVYRAMATQPQTIVATGVGNCPLHAQPWKYVPPGISKKTGQSYQGFYACPVKGCNERPR